MSNSGAITKLSNGGAISGGDASARAGNATGGAGAANSGNIITLSNSGGISGGAARAVSGNAAGGAGVANMTGAKIGNLANAIGGAITGGAGISNGGATGAPGFPTPAQSRS